jgi:hypothetical protein
MLERRIFHRISVDHIVNIKLSDGSNVKAKIINLSERGLAIIYGASAQIGDVLALTFSLSYQDITHDVIINGIVRHSYFKGSNYRIGLEFQDFDDKTLKSIRSFIHYKLSRITV